MCHFTATVTGIRICPNVYELEACEQAVAQKKQELLYARTTVVNISRVDIDMGSSWQYTNSTYNPSVVVVKVENHLGKNQYFMYASVSKCLKKVVIPS